MNIYSCTGNIGRDGEVRQAGQSTVCSFPVGVSTGWGDNKKTLWLDCSIWGKQAEGALTQYLTKGAKVALSGELGQREYTANDGTLKQVLTLRVNSIDLVGDRQAGQQPQQPQQQPQRQAPPQQPQQQAPQSSFSDADIDDMIPF